ncbi:cytochrome P450 [Neurospora intermedia]|uniref:Cytochrome P450 n=1 Tax=Neurospora intermedia TaxID=5142 RepID=A0ABR3D1U8_NEUIN
MASTTASLSHLTTITFTSLAQPLLIMFLLSLLTLYTIYVAIFRLYLSPLADIPGPRLAALTQWYELYYEVILGGQYTFKIIELHKQYGPIIRINPWEVHIADPDFHRVLLPTNTNRRRHRTPFFTKQFGADESIVATNDHDLHKLRRSAVGPFFSTQNTRALQPVIEERVDALMARLREHGKTNKGIPLNMMYACSATSYDIISEYCFAKSEHAVEDPDFRAEITNGILTGSNYGKIFQHFPFLVPFLASIPPGMLAAISPFYRTFLHLRACITAQISEIEKSLRTKEGKHAHLDIPHPTIFHSFVNTEALPPIEKSVPRIAQEGQVIVQAGTVTTSWALTISTFHLLDQHATALAKLRKELREAIPDANEPIELARLEQLPYLRAVIKESMRLSVGASGRITRVAPDETLRFKPSKLCLRCYPDDHMRTTADNKEKEKEWLLPPGTEVSMTSYQITTNPEIFPDPHAFVPERWLGMENEMRLEKYMTVFGHGARVCLGMQLAYAEMYLMLSKMWRVWEGGPQQVGGGEEEDEDGKEKEEVEEKKGRRRDGRTTVGRMRLAEGVTVRDAEMAEDWFIPVPYRGSKGVRVYFESH